MDLKKGTIHAVTNGRGGRHLLIDPDDGGRTTTCFVSDRKVMNLTSGETVRRPTPEELLRQPQPGEKVVYRPQESHPLERANAWNFADHNP